ncbi:MAG: elongation factor G [Anaerolineaceae bacterium]|nr:elongation factor G [Anaerolineaceae bacterium]|tara:strand:+ start:1015 stop:3087 length:2073 start_codon:yes stop_codon:yes gene_type:complete
MNEYLTDSIRNVVLVGHGGSGKTSLVEAMLHVTGATTRLGRVDDGSTVADFEDEERNRQMSISTAMVACIYEDYKINILDTPGFTDFVGEVKSALQVADAAIIVVDAVAGVEVGTELVWDYCNEHNLPRFVVINKMDRDNANYSKALSSVQQLASDKKLIPVALPWGEKSNFQGIIGMLAQKARPGSGDTTEDIPEEYAETVAAARTELEEAAAEGDDELLMRYLDGETLSPDEIEHGFKQAVLSGSCAPVLVASATESVGVVPLLLGITRYLPSPVENPNANETEQQEKDLETQGVFAFKTTADPFVGKLTYLKVMSGILESDTRIQNHTKKTEERIGTLHVMRGKEQIPVKRLHSGDLGTIAKLNDTATGDSLGDKNNPLLFQTAVYPGSLYAVAVRPRTQADSTKMGPTLSKLCEEDPTLSWRNEPSTKQSILEGMGDQHIDIALKRAEQKFGTSLDISTPKVPYRESITSSGDSQYRHKKQSGGAGQFGEVHMHIEPLTSANMDPDGDENFCFKNKVFGGAISANFMPAIEKGIRSVLTDGAVAGFPMEKIFVAITDGKEHPVDSKPIAFEIAAREAFKLAVANASPVLLEPIMLIDITVPESNMGDVMSDLNSRRARVQGMDSIGGKSIVTAEVPLAEVQRYVTDLRSITQGRGVFSLKYLRHEQVPSHLSQSIIDASHSDSSNE